ncbi:hypothetical protein [Dyadobacter jejuensis]|nr:hypothetical protein [Dyadobacter jejuensis]
MLNNELTANELAEFIEGLRDVQQEKHYSDILENYFNHLLQVSKRERIDGANND